MAATLLENILYPVEPVTPKQRTKPMQVLALGLSRMGTESLRRALIMLGYDHVYHGFDVILGGAPSQKAWAELGRRKYGLTGSPNPVTAADLDKLIGHCEAVTDVPCASFALELIEAHPTAKVILNYRDEESWYKSVYGTFSTFLSSWDVGLLSYLDTHLYWRSFSVKIYMGSVFHGSIPHHARRVHKEHRAMIRGSVPAERLLEWKVQDGWEPLCKFLGKPVPNEDFPNGNTPKDFQNFSLAQTRNATRRMLTKLGFLGAGIVAALAYLTFRMTGK